MERLYQYLWKSGVAGNSFRLTDGRLLQVLDPGRLNNDAGPDFFNAKVKVNGTEWAGNVEIHVKASDWLRHGHDNDPAYDSVMLHVVAVNDFQPRRSDGNLIPQLEIVMPTAFYSAYASLESKIKAIRCANRIKELPPLVVTDWLETLAIERLQTKARRVADTLAATGYDWDQTLFIVLARALGFGLNGDPFEMTARSLPLKFIFRHSDSIQQTEALLFGQAGMLDPSLHPSDPYYQGLCREYRFLGRKYGLQPIPPGMWKLSRSRPQNFPHRRLAMLAAMLVRGLPSVKNLCNAASDPDALADLLSVELSGYWSSHAGFGGLETSVPTRLSRASLDLLMINAVAPLVYAYGSYRGEPEMAEAALDLLYTLPAEKNSLIRQWDSLGLRSNSALRSQALLHLRSAYCDTHKCLYCRFARALLKKEARAGYLTPTLFSPVARKSILVAMDSFKGCLSSGEAGEAVARGVRYRLGEAGVAADLSMIQMADGGEGMTAAIAEAVEGEWHNVVTYGPDGDRVHTRWYHTPSDSTAWIEVASAAGLTLLPQDALLPLDTSTFGVGLMMADAAASGVKRIVLGLGGSATTDAALGIIQALGFRLIDNKGDIIPFPACGRDMTKLKEILPPEPDKSLWPNECTLVLACDVDAPMYGPKGAARVFSRQKGASEEEVALLDEGLRNVAGCLKRMVPGFRPESAGYGAAGACGATLCALLGAEIASGADIVLDAVADSKPEGFFQDFDLMITGEGASDRQTLMGKVPVKVLGRVTADCRSVLLSGVIDSPEIFLDAGFSEAKSINNPEIEKVCMPTANPLERAVAKLRLEKAAERYCM